MIKEIRNCWLTLNSREHFDTMDELDNAYADTRNSYQQAVGGENFDKEMLDVMIKSRGVADRTKQLAGSDSKIPAGLNLGGQCMMRIQNSILFFRRLKLRNNTHFHIDYIHNDLLNMQLETRISLNDLHLVGTYERSVTAKDPSILYYTPTFGEVEFLLKDVQYKMEGRYRLVQDRLYLELVMSLIKVNDILMFYTSKTAKSPSLSLQRQNIEEFLDRLKVDLDMWLRDYFNDYLLNFGLAGSAANAKFRQYDKKKALILNEYVDTALSLMKRRLHKLKASAVKLPAFSIYSVNGVTLKLTNGRLQGLDSMYRRSVATGAKSEKNRKVDAVIGFSNLKVIYNYNAELTTEAPPLSGQLFLTADDLTARLGIMMVKNSETVDIRFDFLRQVKPESIIVEGPINRMITNFRYLLELHIVAMMSNTMLYQIKLLSTLTRCKPNFVADIDPNDIKYQNSKETNEIYSDYNQHSTNDNDENKSNEGKTGEKKNNDEESKEQPASIEQLPQRTEVLPETTKTDGEKKHRTENKSKRKEDHIPVETKNQTEISPEADFVLNKQDSIEMELPPKVESHEGQRQSIKYDETFSISKLKSQ
ncbi:uncharacterized protein LOC113520802 [Galleria mellonella]|uniref:Uncharacterized protein LOC113520802 n=1 Tax=Galleria mellonella TaxID=7137 RepID=A0A6J1X6Q8_GALME|nr:uncharacterized protein LOC113520802 [Galleria mellonella]